MLQNRAGILAARCSWNAGPFWHLQPGVHDLAPGWGTYRFSGPYNIELIEEMLACWQVHGEKITRTFIKRCPGRRPWFWWVERTGKEPPAEEATVLDRFGELAQQERHVLEQLKYPSVEKG